MKNDESGNENVRKILQMAMGHLQKDQNALMQQGKIEESIKLADRTGHMLAQFEKRGVSLDAPPAPTPNEKA